MNEDESEVKEDTVYSEGSCLAYLYLSKTDQRV